MSMFPETSLSLIRRMAVEISGERELAWVRFFDLYQPAIRKFAEWHGGDMDPDDVVQNVLKNLYSALRSGGYKPEMGSFKSYLSAMIRNEIRTLYRKAKARGLGFHVPIDQVTSGLHESSSTMGGADRALAVPACQSDEVDLAWASALHETATELVLHQSALSLRNKAIYREHVIKGRSAKEVAAEFGVSKNLVGQIKFRISRAVESLEEEMAGANNV